MICSGIVRDNFATLLTITLKKNETLQTAVQRKTKQVKANFKSVFNRAVTLEQWGEEIDYLECRLGDIAGEQPIQMKHTQWTTPAGSSTPARPSKLIDTTAPNAKDMLATFMPNVNEVKKSTWYRLSHRTA